MEKVLLDNTIVAQALKVIPDKNLLINLASKRAAQLHKNDERPLVDISLDTEGRPLDYTILEVALMEITEGKITYERIES